MKFPQLAFAAFLTLLSSLNGVQAKWPVPKDICVYGCWDWTDHITWDFGPNLANVVDYYEILCTPSIKLDSMVYCAQTYCTNGETLSGLALLNDTCMVQTGKRFPSYESVAIPASQLVDIPRVTQAEGAATANDPIGHPIIPVREWVDLSIRTDHAFYSNIWISYDMSYASFGFWALVLAVGMVYRLVEVADLLRPNPSYDRTHSLPLMSRTWLWIRSHLILPATFGKHCQAPVAGATIPPRLETLVLFVYVILNFIFCFPGYDLFADNQYWPAKGDQLSRYISDRTGHLSLANVPIMWVFAARNNPFIWLTGWSFASFNRFHRWIGRISFVHAFIHSVGYSINAAQEDYYAIEWTYTYWYCGAIATIIMSFILGASVYWMRETHYDLFLVLHIVLAIIFFVTLWDHLHVYEHVYDGFMWPCVAIWVFDRLLRYGRIIYTSVLPRVRKGIRAAVTYDANSEMLRLDVTKFFPGKPPEPGLFYYVYMPWALRGYESHPFTLCSWAPADVDSDLESPTSGSDDEKNVGRSQMRDTAGISLSSNINHSFLIRPYGGFTERLRDGATSKVTVESGAVAGTREETVFLEGPYGMKLDLSTYSDVLVIAGGSGITAAISHTFYLLPTGKTRVQVSWVLPQRHLVDDICNNELAAVMRHPRFKMEVHISSGPDRRAENPHAEPYTVTFGRPDVYEIMCNARESCKSSLAVVSCGTPAMADSCRAAVVRLLKEPGKDVQYYNESMMW